MHLLPPSERPEVPSQTMLRLIREYGNVPVVGSVLRATAPLFKHHPDINEVLQELRGKVNSIPGLAVYLRNPPPIQIGGQVSNSPYQLTLQSPDTEELYRVATSFEQKMEALPGLTDVTSDLQISESASRRQYRPRQSVGAWCERGAGRRRALHRLRAEADFHDLRSKRRILGDDGTRRSVSERSVRSLAAVRPVEHRQSGAVERGGERGRQVSGRSASTTSGSFRR